MRGPALASLVLLAACGGGTEITFDVDHYQVPCVRETLQLCLFVRGDETEAWERYFGPIEGYEHEWGVPTRLRVLERAGLSAGGGSNISIILDEVLETSSIEPGTTFTYPFRPGDDTAEVQSVSLSGNGGTLLDGKSFTCASTAICEELEEGTQSNATVVMDLEYTDPVSGPLLLTSVVLSQAPGE